MSDDDINGLAHELWALAQGVAPISDLVDLMIPELQKFAAAVRAAERERCAALCEGLREAAEHSSDGLQRAGAMSMATSCARMIRSRE